MLKTFGKINVFVDEKTIGGNVSKVFSTSIDTEQTDKTKVRGYLDVRFSKKFMNETRYENMKPGKCYTLDIMDGWLAVRSYESNGTIKKVFYIFVNDAKPVAIKDCKPRPEKPKAEDDGELPW